VRAPQRVSTPPSSGLDVAPPWPSPTSSCPPDRPFFSRAGEGPSRRTARFVPSPSPSFRFGLIFSFSNRLWGIRVCSRVQSEWESRVPFLLPLRIFFCIFFLFFSLVHPERGSRVRVRLNPIRVFFWFDSRSLRLSPSPLPLLFF